MKRITFLLIVLLGPLVSCEEVVDISLEQGPKRLVVEGRIEYVYENPEKVQSIKLSQTQSFYANQAAPPATGATVSVTDSDGNIYLFTEIQSQPGLYQNSELRGQIGQSYQLYIYWNGAEYAATETLQTVPEIDALYQVLEEESLFDEAGLRMAVDYTDPASEVNYYLWEVFVNGQLIITPEPSNRFSLIQEDQFFNGNKVIGYIPNDEYSLQTGDIGTVRQIGLSKSAFDYYFQFYNLTGNQGGLFNTPPSGLAGNVQNLTNPELYPLGYFSAAQVSEKSMVAEETP